MGDFIVSTRRGSGYCAASGVAAPAPGCEMPACCLTRQKCFFFAAIGIASVMCVFPRSWRDEGEGSGGAGEAGG